MNRITHQRYAELIGAALDILPGALRPLLESTDFFVGDPNFAGIHNYKTPPHLKESYRDVMHFCTPYNLRVLPKDRRDPTVVIPERVFEIYPMPSTVSCVVHELGHHLDWMIDYYWNPEVEVSRYAGVNRAESFAEFFSVWCQGPIAAGAERDYHPETMQEDLETIWFFERLAEGWMP